MELKSCVILFSSFLWSQALALPSININNNKTVKSDCCHTIEITSDGVTLANQWTRLGKFYLDGEEGGRPYYLQDNGQNYLYFLGAWTPGYDWWYVGDNLGVNMGGMINMDKNTICPDQISVVWEAYAWTGEWADVNDWVPDPDLKIRCVNGEETTPSKKTTTDSNSNHESCTWGNFCDGCSVTSVVNGVTYCCANECNSGGININHDSDGGVQCYCYH